MKTVGDIRVITHKREDKQAAVEVHVGTIHYTTFKKDGRYFHEHGFEDRLETPLVITGDCLARTDSNKKSEGDFEYQVYDKEDGEYVLNENKKLEVTVVYHEEEDLPIINSLTYTVILPAAEFEQFKKDREKEKSFKQTKAGKKRR